MSRWHENSEKNILALSMAPVFADALNEWQFTGKIEYFGADACGTCELCGQPHLASQYLIKNGRTSEKLWVGSTRILKFTGIQVFNDDKVALTDDDARRKQLDKALNAKLQDMALQPLRGLYSRADEQERENMSGC